MSHRTVGDSATGDDRRRFTGPIPPAPRGTPACLNCGGPIGVGPARRFCSSRCYRHAVYEGRVAKPECPVCGHSREPRIAWDSEACRLAVTAAVVARDGGRCWLCGGSLDMMAPNTDPMRATLDHFVPHVAGGESTVENLRLAHSRCNADKGEAIPMADGRLVDFVHPDLLLLHGPNAAADNPVRLARWDAHGARRS